MTTASNNVLVQVTLSAVVIIIYQTGNHTGTTLQYRSHRDLYRNYYRDDDGIADLENDSTDDDDDYNDDDDEDVRPTFLATESNVTVSPGEEVLLRCFIRNLVDRTVTWRRLGTIHPMTIGVNTFVSDSRISVDQTDHVDAGYSEWNLRLTNVTPSDEGIYRCQVNTKDDQMNFYNVYLQVTIIQVTGTKTVERGGVIQLLCNATGRPDPPHNVEWYKDDRMIESDVNEGIFITKKIETKLLISVLVIKRSKTTDAGAYHCRSSDRQDIGKITVNVLNAPVEKRGTSAEKITSGNASSSKAICFRCCVWCIWFLAIVTMR